MRAYGEDLRAIWENWHSEHDRFVDAGGEQVLWLYRIVGQGKGSGVPVDQPIAIVYTLRDGLIWRGQVFLDQRSALEAVGLEG
jgi:ketosteroid isomerase-like protein